MKKERDGLKTYEFRLKLPKNFLSKPGIVELNSLQSSRIETLNDRELLVFLTQNIIRHTFFFDQAGKYIIPCYFSEKEGNELIPISPDSPQHLHDDALGSVLFSHDVPILGLVSDCLRLAKKIGQQDNQIQHTEDDIKYTWSMVVSSLFDQFIFYDVDGNKINKGDIDKIRNALFGKEQSVEALEQNPQNLSFQELILEYIKQYFNIDLNNGIAEVKDPTILNVYLGSAQRAVTPFCFGNCKEGCRFCYVDRRLSTLVYPNNWFRSLNEIIEILNSYDPETKIGLAQPRMAMMDWEPTEHPEFLKIMKAIAERDPKSQIPIVTHGGNLTDELLNQIARDPQLKELLLFQVSLNSANPYWRREIMPGKGNNPLHHENAIASLEKMHDLGIAFDVSIVAVTNWIPMGDILNTINFADRFQPYSFIRVALPTATRDHDPSMFLSPDQLADIDRQVVAHREKVSTPIILTVGLLNRTGLGSEIEGVMPNSPAYYAGIKHGSIILSINGVQPRSRTESTLMLLDNWIRNQRGDRQPCVVVFEMPDGSQKEVDLIEFPQKKPRFLGEKPVGVYGLLIHDDVDFGIFERMRSLQTTHSFENPLMITSKVMFPFFQQTQERVLSKERVDNLKIIAAENKFFGGNVCIAGLLTFSDIFESLRKEVERGNLTHKPDVIFISASMISRAGYDLQGYHYRDLASLLGIPVIPLKARTGSL